MNITFGTIKHVNTLSDNVCTSIQSMKIFIKSVVSIFLDEYLRSPNNNDIVRLQVIRQSGTKYRRKKKGERVGGGFGLRIGLGLSED